MSERMYGSIDVTKIIELMKGGHSSISKSEKNGHIYMNIVQWVNDQEDEYGNKCSIQPSPNKNASELEKQATKKIYLGNLKLAKPEPLAAQDIADAENALNKLGSHVQNADVIKTTLGTGAGQPAANGAQVSAPVVNSDTNDGLPF